MIDMYCFVRGCKGYQKHKFVTGPRNEYYFCDEHYDQARILADVVVEKVHELEKELCNKFRDMDK